jgi:hypothetical protein
MKKNITTLKMYPFPPSSFHLFIYLGKKNINLHPPPPQQKKKKEKNQGAPFAPSHNEYNINLGPYKLQTVKKSTKK